MYKRLLSIFLIFILVLTACGNKSAGEDDKENGDVEFEFWTAPSPTHETFWVQMADAYTDENPNVKIDVSQMPESPTSEAGIQTALAAGSAPAISQNISRGFAAQLAESEAILPLNEFEGFEDLISEREMTETMSSWEFSDGNQYVFPGYSSPILMAWRIDILKELGFDKPPTVYSEVIEIGEKLKEEYPDKHLWIDSDFANPTWYKRWFDFFPLYNAASDGNKFIEDSKLIADDVAGIKTLTFFQELIEKKLLLARETTDPFESGESILTNVRAGHLEEWEQKFPEMKLDETFALSMPVIPDEGTPDNLKTFADTKGVSIYTQASQEQQQAAFDFITWVYSNPENDLEWFKKTNSPPSRDDLASNEVFTEYLEEKPALKIFAENIPNALPTIDNVNFAEVLESLGTEALVPIIGMKKKAEDGWQDMTEAIKDKLDEN